MSKACMFDFSVFISSFTLSKIKTLASTAIPTVKMIPAIPGSVSVASTIVRIPINNTKFIISVRSAIIPKRLYLYNMYKMTKRKPIAKDINPALIESSPKSGPTVLSSIMFKGAGRAPDLNSYAKSVAD